MDAAAGATVAWAVAFGTTRRKPFLALVVGFGTNTASGVIQIVIDYAFFFSTRYDAGVPLETILAEQQAWFILFQVLHTIFYAAVILAAILFWQESKGRKRGKTGGKSEETRPEELDW